uniref:BPL/LPL catalytic domain-containing protein n=1 Tax=Caenorhabditis japonica TaxID=281687 RepID=A0A8R1DF75_CAEJA
MYFCLFQTHNVLSHGEVLLTWSNTPSVVVGRHQNPWIEVNIPYAEKNGIKVFISDALNSQYSLNIIPNKRDDMELQPGNRKCSGTAARIARGQAYHHLTLLIDANLSILSNSLKSPWQDQIETNSTRSVKAPAVGFVRQENPTVTVENSRKTIVEAYRTLFDDSRVENVDVAAKVRENPQISKIVEELKTWKWIYGKSPKFTYSDSNGNKVEVKDGLEVDSGKPFIL